MKSLFVKSLSLTVDRTSHIWQAWGARRHRPTFARPRPCRLVLGLGRAAVAALGVISSCCALGQVVVACGVAVLAIATSLLKRGGSSTEVHTRLLGRSWRNKHSGAVLEGAGHAAVVGEAGRVTVAGWQRGAQEGLLGCVVGLGRALLWLSQSGWRRRGR